MKETKKDDGVKKKSTRQSTSAEVSKKLSDKSSQKTVKKQPIKKRKTKDSLSATDAVAITDDQIKSVLIKKALGYDSTETVEEYVNGEEGEIKLSKRKVTVKAVPPDMAALKILIDDGAVSVDKMTDEELEAEKQRLLATLKENL